jgi:hypothetical protein
MFTRTSYLSQPNPYLTILFLEDPFLLSSYLRLVLPCSLSPIRATFLPSLIPLYLNVTSPAIFIRPIQLATYKLIIANEITKYAALHYITGVPSCLSSANSSLRSLMQGICT